MCCLVGAAGAGHSKPAPHAATHPLRAGGTHDQKTPQQKRLRAQVALYVCFVEHLRRISFGLRSRTRLRIYMLRR